MRIGTDTTDPYEAVWHTRLLDNGFHGIVVRAEDAAGARGEDARDITIANPNGVRYAAPGANGPDPCLQTDPCELVHAVRHAVSGDEVVVLPGDYALPNGLFVNRRVDLHGVSGQPRPRLLSAGGFGAIVFQTPASLSHLHIEATQDDATGVLASTFGTPVLSDLVVVVSGQSTRAISIEDGNALVRDSVARAPSANSIALFAGGAGTVDLRNVTAWATGANSVGIVANGCDATLDTCIGGARTITARNVVTRGTVYDLSATTNSPTYPGTINVSHSNFRPGAVNVSAGAAVNNQGNNQSAEPLFANAAAGDFHQLPGSPTIDAGAGDDKIGPTDFDGQPRTMGAAPDIGADEFLPLAAPVAAGGCTINGTDGNDRITGTRGNDVICAGKGNDVVKGGGGNDVIRLGAGNDKGYGGPGKDRIVGGKGKDRLFGGGGNDTLLAKDRVKKEIVDGGPGKKDVCKMDRGDLKRRCP
jgi:Ca2+-binding RTX toxin-like protein